MWVRLMRAKEAQATTQSIILFINVAFDGLSRVVSLP
jgi:hypothetical protein